MKHPISLLAAVLLSSFVISPSAFSAEGAKPNIVVIVADDLGYADVLFNPAHPKEVTTPHLDALAKESVICRQGYVSGHVCSPTRAGLMTGRYQQRLGLYTGGEAGGGLPMSEKIFPQHFKPAGYATAQFGKWHLGPDVAWSPALRGFDEVFGFLGRGAHDYFKLNDPDDPIYRGTTPVQETGYLTDRLGEEAAAFIARKKSQPFLVYLAFNAVHAPLQAPADEIGKFSTGNADRDTLLAMGKRMDDAIGKVVATLKAEGVWENTLLFFISDNGGPLAQSAVNTPLRGGKHQDYEGGIRVPFLVCWPGKLKPGESQAVVSSLDFLPTALAAAGVVQVDSKPFDGRNIMPVLRGGETSEPRNLFWSSGSEEGWWAVRSGDWKLVGEKARVGLFDLSKDVSEKNDLASQMPEKVAELTKLHDAWLGEMANPKTAGAKRFGMPLPEGAKVKKPKSERKKNQGAPLPKAPGNAANDGSVGESFAKAAHGAWETKPTPEFQYKSAGIEVPAATADEPRVKAFGADTIQAAAKYLDDGAHHWVREKSCIACHSTGVYMVERSALTRWLGKPSEEVLADFIDEVPKDGGKDASPIKSVWRSSGLASWDRHVAGKLSEHTDRSLRSTLTLLTDDGSFRTIKQVEIPYITTHFELTVQAARAITTAPGWLENLKDADTIARVERMKKFLHDHEPVNDYELALKLQLSTLLPDLVPPPVRDAATAMLWRQQQPDGGWSTRRMSDLMRWHETMDPLVVTMIQGEPDAASPGSDPYMTAWAIVLLRESGVPADDARMQKGIAWLKANQRESGRWWMKSLYRDTYHYITYISTAQALRALALCGELPAASRL